MTGVVLGSSFDYSGKWTTICCHPGFTSNLGLILPRTCNLIYSTPYSLIADEEDPAATGGDTAEQQSSADVTTASAAKKQKSADDVTDPFDIDAMEEAPVPPTSQKKKKPAKETPSAAAARSLHNDIFQLWSLKIIS